jgi:hypothetical protein
VVHEHAAEPTRNDRLRAGLRAGLPFAVAGAVLALSFGVVAQDAGLSRTSSHRPSPTATRCTPAPTRSASSQAASWPGACARSSRASSSPRV